MTDVILIIVIVAFFAAMSLLVRACGRVIRTDVDDAVDVDESVDPVPAPGHGPAA
ncbi:MAG TPA: hypothetical protein VEI83_10955 [Acidimicrobiales bacterium]|nr:hypothetical protein [Acidimicrobiales bacterium]